MEGVFVQRLRPHLDSDAGSPRDRRATPPPIHALALTCSALRGLVQRTFTGALTLEDAAERCGGSAAAVHAATQHLAERFPNATSAYLSIQDGNHHVNVLPLLSGLSGIPTLEHMNIGVRDKVPGGFAAVLAEVQQQVTQLRKLTLFIVQEASDSAAADAAMWHVLSTFTQLTELKIESDCRSDDGEQAVVVHNMSHLAPLSSLQSLQALKIKVRGGLVAAGPPYSVDALPPPLSFLSGLGALTSLDVMVPAQGASGLASIAACSGLQRLKLRRVPGPPPPPLGAEVCAALGSLTALTELELKPGIMAAQHSDFYDAMRCMRGLQRVTYSMWCIETALPVIAGLTDLSFVGGSGDLSDASGGTAIGAAAAFETALGRELPRTSICPHVLCASGLVPLQAFPNLQVYIQAGPLTPAVFVSVAEHCPKLVSWRSSQEKMSPDALPEVRWPSLREVPLSGQRVTALLSLQRLRHLARLDFHPSHDRELAALVAGLQLCDADDPSAQRSIDLAVSPLIDGFVTAAGLAQLGSCRLESLRLCLAGVVVDDDEVWQPPELLMIACAVRGARRAELCAWPGEDGLLRAAQEHLRAAQAAGLQLRGEVFVDLRDG